MTLVDQIRELIASGETERSLEELFNFVKESNADVIDNLVMLRSRMQNVNRAVQTGTMNDQDAAIERAKINDAILKLLPQMTPEYLAEASKRKAPIATPMAAAAAPASGNNMKTIYIIAGVVVVLLLLVLAFGGDDDEGDPENVNMEQGYDQQEGDDTYDQQQDDGTYDQQEDDGTYDQQEDDDSDQQQDDGGTDSDDDTY